MRQLKLPNLTEGKLEDQGYLDQYLEEWLYPRESQTDHGFFSEEEKQESINIEGSDPEGSTISKQDPYGAISTMMVIKQSYKIKGPRVEVYGPLCSGLYK